MASSPTPGTRQSQRDPTNTLLNPQCYLGKKRLERAIDVYKKTYPGGKNDTFTVHWSPFYLDPTAPKVGIPVAQRLAQKFGPARTEAIHARLRHMGQADNVNFTFSGLVGNTRDSHRLIQLAKTNGIETEDRVVDSLMKSYFEEGGDITSTDMLVAAGARGGLDADEARRWLDEGRGGDEVDDEVDDAYRQGISGVPHFVIDDKWEVHGASDVEVFVEQFAAAKEDSSSNGTRKSEPENTC